MLILYGIKNCDTVKKARTWLDGRAIAYHFHDYKTGGIDKASLEGWIHTHGWETLLNRKGSSFRALPEVEKEDLNEEKAIRLMMANPSMIKRPVLVNEKEDSLIGFNPEHYANFLDG